MEPRYPKAGRRSRPPMRATPREQIAEEIDKAIMEVIAAFSAHNAQPSGPLVVQRRSVSDAPFDFEVGFPIDGVLASRGRMRVMELPAIAAARTTYTGSYENLYPAWSEFGARFKAMEQTRQESIVCFLETEFF